MQYLIGIDIDTQGLNEIYNNNQYVTLVKSVVSNPTPSSNLPVAWLAFQPLPNNKIIWEETYYLYATTTNPLTGATIIMASLTDAPVRGGEKFQVNREE